MIARFRRARSRLACGVSAELAELRGRVARMRREVAALQEQADALNRGVPVEALPPCPWRDPEAVTHG